MLKESRIKELLEEIFDSNSTPEVVCADSPELLDEVDKRWRLMRRVNSQLEDLFPGDRPQTCDDPEAVQAESELPRINGYDFESILGRGGMGVVFKARHHKLNRRVALKTMRSGRYANSIERARFQREAEAVAAIRHPNIVEIFDVGDLVGAGYFTMEFLEGGSLAQKLAGKPQSARQAAELVATLAGAVQFAHQSGFIHRDLKPSNILFTAEGIPKITDFGLARSIRDGPEFTLSGARVGTPSYMAPEQALGKASAIGPAVDIYALGVVLYEMLTGRPPFAAESAAEIERQTIGNEPPPPSRLNAKVPRDLETVCLKCLEKNPARRYASAQDLADDLYRFLDGKPVLARPVGVAQRVWKWARRRPAIAVLLVAFLSLSGTAVGTGIWLRRERCSRQEIARNLILAEIPRAYKSAEEEKWQDATGILTDAQHNLDFADSDELGGRVASARADLQFVEGLERIRQRHVFAEAYTRSRRLANNQECAKEYAEAFAQAHLDLDRAESAVARIQATPLRPQIVAALDLWAFLALDAKNESLQRQLLRIARLADPDAWRDRFRDANAWRDKEKLARLADDAAKMPVPPPAHQLAITGRLLSSADPRVDIARLMREALRVRPGDYWLNWEMGDALDRGKRRQEAVTYFRIALAIRPENPWALDRLSGALDGAGQVDEAVAIGRKAVDLEPHSNLLRYNFAVKLFHARRFDESRAQYERILETDPANTLATLAIATAYAYSNRRAEAIPVYRRVIESDPKSVAARYNLGFSLLALGRTEEAATAFEGAVTVDPAYFPAHIGLALTSLRLGKHEKAVAEFQWVLQRLDRDKTVASDYGVDMETVYRDVWRGLAQSLSCLGRFAEARQAAQKALDRIDESQRGEVQRRLERCRQLLAVESRLPAVLAGKEAPADVATRRALAEWLYEDRQFNYASARLYWAVFAQQPSLADDLESQDRLRAACAAGQAGCGIGEDATGLSQAVKAKLRKQALAWLEADRDAWKQRLQSGSSAERSKAARTFAGWSRNKDLACLCNQADLAKLPASESKEWQGMWAEVNAIAAGDPVVQRLRGYEYARHKEWAKAAEVYAGLVSTEPSDDAEVWFECAAVQLLAGDTQGYRATCRQMLKRPPGASRLRPYLVARACTLASDSVDDPAQPMSISSEELNRSANAFWSLTERGAVCCRAKREGEAVALFERSLQAESKPGCAVLNWLWLAVAHQQLGERDEARRRLDQAVAWLDSLGNESPTNDAGLKLHMHDWLEANVLRKEAELAIGTSRRGK